MNISPLTIYLWQLADNVISALGPVSVFSALVALASAAFWGCSYYEYATSAAKVAEGRDYKDEMTSSLGACTLSRRSSYLTSIVFLLSTAGFIFTPRSNTIAMMVIIPEIARSKVVQQDLPDIYNAAVKALKDQLTK